MGLSDLLAKKSSIQVCCCPQDLSNLNKFILSKYPNLASSIRNTCFGGLLDVHLGPLSVYVCLHIIDKWNSVSKHFVSGNGTVIPILVEDVKSMYSLTSKGDSLFKVEWKKIDISGAKELCKKYGIALDGRCKSSAIGESILKALKENADLLRRPKEYCILYAYYSLFRVLVPTSGTTITLKWLVKLMEPNLGVKYNWSEAVHERLVNSLSHTKDKYSAPSSWNYLRPAGDLHFLMVSFYIIIIYFYIYLFNCFLICVFFSIFSISYT